MRRRAAVVTLLALVVTLAPVAVLADHSQRVVASQHTDFGTAGEPAPQTLDNMTVVGSGPSASVVLDGSGVVDDFESGDTTTKSANWDGWNGDTGVFTAQQTTALSGQWSGELTQDTTDDAVSTQRDSTIVGNITWQVQIDGQNNDINDYTAYRIRSGGTTGDLPIRVRFVQNGSIAVVNGAGTNYVGSWSVDTTYRMAVEPDFGADQFTLYQDGSSLGTFNFQDSVSDYDTFIISGNEDSGSFNSYIDDVEAAAAASGTYEGANHSVENAREIKVNMTLRNATADLSAIDPTGQSGFGGIMATDTVSSTGNHSISFSNHQSSKVQVGATITAQSGPTTAEIHDVSVLFDAESPSVDNASASPTGDLSQFQNTYTIDVNDSDFPLAQGDSVTAELFIDGSSEGTDTLTSNGTASVTATTSTGGSHTYNWTVTDDYGLSHTSQDFEVRIPDTIEIFNETSPQTKLTGVGDVTVRSFAEDIVIENTTTNGEIGMTGFPMDQEFVVKVSIDQFHDTTVIFDDIYQQQKVWMLNETIDSNQARFTLTDNTGDFQDDPKLLIERPLNHTGDNTTWEIIRADEFGAAGFTTDLETDTRHRLTVEAVDGAQRSVGPYTTSIDETVPLTIGSGRLNLTTGADSYTFNATYENVSGTEQIRWGFADPDGLTTDLNVTIYEYQNASNRIYSQTFSDPSNLIATQMLMGNQPNLTWTVDWEATRDGETIGGKQTVGRFVNEQASALPAWLQEAVAIVVLMLTAGAFSQRNFAAGAVVVALMGGVFWMGGWLTGVTSGAGVAGALALGILYKWARDVR